MTSSMQSMLNDFKAILHSLKNRWPCGIKSVDDAVDAKIEGLTAFIDETTKRYGHLKDPVMIHNLWDNQRGWGHNIDFIDWDRRRLMGHHHDRRSFRIGDEVRAKMRSGKIARFSIKNVEYCNDPKDMFFADLEDIGYLES